MRNMKKTKSYFSGYSLIEMLVVLVIFTFLGIVVTQSLASSLRGTRKSENQNITKENVDYAMSVMERLLRNASDLNCATSTATRLNYTDESGRAVYFMCDGTPSAIASGSATPPVFVNLLTSASAVNITSCAGVVFACVEGVNVPDSVTITLTGQYVTTTGAEGSQVTSTSRILLRTY